LCIPPGALKTHLQDLDSAVGAILKQFDKERTDAFRARSLRMHRRSLGWIPPVRGFSAGALAMRLRPPICDFAAVLMAFEHIMVVGLPKGEAKVHCLRAQVAIRDLILAGVPWPADWDKDLSPQVAAWRLVPATDHSSAYEEGLDQRHRVVDVRSAPYAEPQGEAERVPSLGGGEQWGILRWRKLRALVRAAVNRRLLAEAARIIDDRRTRTQIVEDFKSKHPDISNEAIGRTAGVDLRDFYHWRSGDPLAGPFPNRSTVHRRLMGLLLELLEMR
jgi:hypothetical protein